MEVTRRKLQLLYLGSPATCSSRMSRWEKLPPPELGDDEQGNLEEERPYAALHQKGKRLKTTNTTTAYAGGRGASLSFSPSVRPPEGGGGGGGGGGVGTSLRFFVLWTI